MGCSCGKFEDMYHYRGMRRGVYEVHTVDFCQTKDLKTWRIRLFGRIAKWFDWLAGDFNSHDLEELLQDEQSHWIGIGQETERTKRREALEKVYDQMRWRN